MTKRKPSDHDVALPYPEPDGTFTGGWSGSDTSKDRAVDEARDGTLQKRQQEVLNFIARRKWSGATWKEVSSVLGIHHGQSSGALSNLHKAGRVARLDLKRGKCAVYVHPDFVEGRTVKPYGRVRPGTERVGTESQPIPQASPQALLAAEGVGYQKGLREGRKQGEDQAMEHLQEFLTNLMAVVRPNVAMTHTRDCYKKHPVCALRAVKNYADKAGVRV
jgi:hypothetical protein